MESPSNEIEAKRLAAKAKESARNGELDTALSLFNQAYSLVPSEKLQNRITKLKASSYIHLELFLLTEAECLKPFFLAF